MTPQSKSVKKIAAALAAIILLLLVASSSFRIVPTGYTGVKTTFGQIKNKPVPSGIVFKIPVVQEIIKVNNKQQDIVFDDQIWAETSNRTAIKFEGVSITYQISSEKSAWLVANLSNYETGILTQAVIASAVKAASKELDDVDATNRGKIEPLAQTKLQSILDSKYGENAVYINKVTITNVEFEQTYNEAIAAKQNAQLAYEKAAIENKQAIEKAEADAKVKQKTAEGNAAAKKIEAEAEAQANKIISDSLSDKVLANRYYEKWDGKLPAVTGEGSVILPSDIIKGNSQ